MFEKEKIPTQKSDTEMLGNRTKRWKKYIAESSMILSNYFKKRETQYLILRMSWDGRSGDVARML